jgi:hypothetical protein
VHEHLLLLFLRMERHSLRGERARTARARRRTWRLKWYYRQFFNPGIERREQVAMAAELHWDAQHLEVRHECVGEAFMIMFYIACDEYGAEC